MKSRGRTNEYRRVCTPAGEGARGSEWQAPSRRSINQQPDETFGCVVTKQKQKQKLGFEFEFGTLVRKRGGGTGGGDHTPASPEPPRPT
jgi:hypothetical protein